MSFSVSDVLNYYFNNKNHKISSNRSIGYLFHKIIGLYLLFKNEFNMDFFYKSYRVTDKDKYILINLLKETLEFLNNKNNWKLMFIEENIKYNNIYGKPDIILEYKYININYDNYFFLMTQYYYNIKMGILNYNILENHFSDYYNKKKIILIDWKCYFNQNIFKILYNKLNYFLKYNLLYTSYNRTMIQMNIYKYILESKYDFYVSEMYMYLIDPNTFKYQLIPILNLKREFIVFLIENFIKYNNINNNVECFRNITIN